MPEIKNCRQDFRSLAPFAKARSGSLHTHGFHIWCFCKLKKKKEARLPDRQNTPADFRCVIKILMYHHILGCRQRSAFMNSQARYQHSRNYLGMYCETNSP